MSTKNIQLYTKAVNLRIISIMLCMYTCRLLPCLCASHEALLQKVDTQEYALQKFATLLAIANHS